MNRCDEHPDQVAVDLCSDCGAELCAECRTEVARDDGDALVLCPTHAAEEADEAVPPPPPIPPPPMPPPPISTVARPRHSSGVAFLFGLLPGIGHLYIGRFRRAVQLSAAFVASIFLASEGLWIFGFAAAFLVFFSAFEAAREARTADTPSIDAAGTSRFFGIFLVLAGVLAWLRRNLDIDLGWLLDQWPLLLVVLGIWMVRTARPADPSEDDAP